MSIVSNIPREVSMETELRRQALAIDAAVAQSSPGPAAAVSPQAVWEGMLEGALTITDSFESDGRWFLIARYRAGGPTSGGGLTDRERQVLTLAIRGHRNKVVAAELGLTSSTIATHLRRALLKLGLPSRLSLLRALPALLDGAAATHGALDAPP